MTSSAVESFAGPQISFRGRSIPVILPSRRDPRLKLSAVIFSLQILGQTVLGFKLSIAQILVTIGVCAAIEIVLTFRREDRLVWPASGILTGNSIAFILRASGTEHGDWWSFNGIEFFVIAAVLSLMSKHLIRFNGKHVFNPSNVGIVWTLLVVGPGYVFPQYLWWGPVDTPVILAMAVILLGAVWVLRSVRMIPMAASFLVPFAALVGLFALGGKGFYAIWHSGPVEGMSYWLNIWVSPEVLIFVFFMMSDPQTAPKSQSGRMIYGAGSAVVAAALLFFQPTEFGIKVAILSSLTLMCALVPLIEKVLARTPAEREVKPRTRAAGRWKVALRDPAIAAAAVVAIAAPLNTAALADNQEIILLERGLSGERNPQ